MTTMNIRKGYMGLCDVLQMVSPNEALLIHAAVSQYVENWQDFVDGEYDDSDQRWEAVNARKKLEELRALSEKLDAPFAHLAEPDDAAEEDEP